MLEEICIKRLNIIPYNTQLPKANGNDLLAWTANFMSLGIKIEGLEYIASNHIAMEKIYNLLSDRVGNNKVNIPLYTNFPYSTPDLHEELIRRMVGYFFSVAGIAAVEELFSLEDYGNDPITQMYSEEIRKAAIERDARKEESSCYKITTLTVVSEEEGKEQLGKWAVSQLESPNPLSTYLIEELKSAVISLRLKCSPQLKESSAVYVGAYWDDYEFEDKLFTLRYPDELLRMLAAVVGNDISLTAAVEDVPAFPNIRRAARVVISKWLSSKDSKVLEESFFKYSELWKFLFRSIHIFDNRVRASDDLKTSVKKLLENKDDLYTFERELNSLEGVKKLKVLATRPTLFMRRIRENLKTASFEVVVGVFEEVIPQIGGRALLSFSLMAENDHKDTHTITTMKNGDTIRREKSIIISEEQGKELSLIVNREIASRIRAYVGDRTFSFGEDLQQIFSPDTRGASDSAAGGFFRGKVIPFDKSLNLVPFLYWEEKEAEEGSYYSNRVDLDLHVVETSAKGHQEDCYYAHSETNTQMYSGDIQEAPAGTGAFEATKITFSEMHPRNFYYPYIHVYSGMALEEVRMGWMERDWVNSDTNYKEKPYSTKSVVNYVTLVSSRLVGNSYWVPFVVDVENERLIVLDAYTNTLSNVTNDLLAKVLSAPKMSDLILSAVRRKESDDAELQLSYSDFEKMI